MPTSFVVTATDSARLEAQAASIGAATLIRTIDELANALTAVREGDDARMAVEIALSKRRGRIWIPPPRDCCAGSSGWRDSLGGAARGSCRRWRGPLRARASSAPYRRHPRQAHTS